MKYDHPSQLKISILQVFEDGKRYTSSELSEILGLKKEVARNQLSRYKKQGLLDHQRETGYNGGKNRPVRVYHYYITDRGRKRLNRLRSAEELFQSSKISWKEALEKFNFYKILKFKKYF